MNSSQNFIQIPSLNALEPTRKTYSGNVPLQTIVGLIPYVGSVIDSVITKLETEAQQERLKFFLAALKEGLEKLDENTIQKEWINSAEFYDILVRTIETAKNTRSREKVLINVRILLNVLSVPNDGAYRPEEYLHSLEQLTPTEVKALLVIYDEFTSKEINKDQNDLQFASSLNWRERVCNECGIDEADIDFIIKRLENTGFIAEITGTYFDYNGGQIKITKSLLRFMEYLNNDFSL